ncbi:sigma 54-interacting transcriptional regulator [Oceanobacillus locisalsi]|uniref:Sigma 54-interacting transcriptional regulator n=1 Tax=Oceanobacillus locisalsi TaxID=546107 RepID=A0ABW3NL60_9BACI
MLQMNSQEQLNEVDSQAGRWMKNNPEVIYINETVEAAAELFSDLAVEFLPVVGESMSPVGIITSRATLKACLQGERETSIANYISQEDFSIIRKDEFIIDFYEMPYSHFFVVNEKQQLIGILTRKEIQQCLSSYMKELNQTFHTAEILDVILERAYEGVAVVDQEGIIVEFNEAYSSFTGINQKDAVGCPVQKIIENTNLHNTARNGLPERGVIQYIQGQPMVVHRIPIWREEKLVGAIGMLIFEGVTELYQIYNRFLEKTKQTPVNKNQMKKPLQENRIEHASIEKIKGSSKQITDLKRITRKVAKTYATVLITGESGTGKELIAKSIHELSYYQNGPFISVNCGAIPDQLFESELFGYADGAFTGAKKGGKPGKLELAKGGTLLLDEIGEMPLMMQTKLLRVLQEKEFERVGAVQKEKLEARIVVATNRNLLEMVRDGLFREDLYYRINVIEIPIPPLRERIQDIPVLISHYLKSLCKKYDIPEKEVTPEAMTVFMNYAWYGNIRELINTMEKLIILVESNVIDVDHIPNYLKHFDLLESPYIFQQEMKNKEKEVLMKALEENEGNKSKAAKELGMHRTTLYKKMKKYGLYK